MGIADHAQATIDKLHTNTTTLSTVDNGFSQEPRRLSRLRHSRRCENSHPGMRAVDDPQPASLLREGFGGHAHPHIQAPSGERQ